MFALSSCEQKGDVTEQTSEKVEIVELAPPSAEAYFSKEAQVALPAVKWAIRQKDADLIKKVWLKGENSEARSLAIHYLLQWVDSDKTKYSKQIRSSDYEEADSNSRESELYIAYEKLRSDYSKTSQYYKDFVEKFFISEANRKHIETADKVLLSRIILPEDKSNQWREFDSYVVSLTREISSQQNTILLKNVFDAGNDDPFSSKGCIPNFGFRVSFVKDGKVLDINFCFQCGIMCLSKNSKFISGSDFNRSEEELLALMKTIFKEDKAIQDLDL